MNSSYHEMISKFPNDDVFPGNDKQINIACLLGGSKVTSSSSLGSNSKINNSQKKQNLRRGKWTPEEERYTNKIIEAFKSGTLVLPENVVGVTLRSYLADKLECDPMRITKKYTGASCLGKRVYYKDRFKAPAEDVMRVQLEIQELEKLFRDKLQQSQTYTAEEDPDSEFHSNPIPDNLAVRYRQLAEGFLGMKSDSMYIPKLTTFPFSFGINPSPAYKNPNHSTNHFRFMDAAASSSFYNNPNNSSSSGAAPAMSHHVHSSQNSRDAHMSISSSSSSSSSSMNQSHQQQHMGYTSMSNTGMNEKTQLSTASLKALNCQIEENDARNNAAAGSDPNNRKLNPSFKKPHDSACSSVSSLSSQDNDKKEDSDSGNDDESKPSSSDGGNISDNGDLNRIRSDSATNNQANTSKGSSCTSNEAKSENNNNTLDNDKEIASSLLGLFRDLKQDYQAGQDLINFVTEVQKKHVHETKPSSSSESRHSSTVIASHMSNGIFAFRQEDAAVVPQLKNFYIGSPPILSLGGMLSLMSYTDPNIDPFDLVKNTGIANNLVSHRSYGQSEKNNKEPTHREISLHSVHNPFSAIGAYDRSLLEIAESRCRSQNQTQSHHQSSDNNHEVIMQSHLKRPRSSYESSFSFDEDNSNNSILPGKENKRRASSLNDVSNTN